MRRLKGPPGNKTVFRGNSGISFALTRGGGLLGRTQAGARRGVVDCACGLRLPSLPRFGKCSGDERGAAFADIENETMATQERPSDLQVGFRAVADDAHRFAIRIGLAR